MKSVTATKHPNHLDLTTLWLGLPVFLLACKAFIFPLPLLDFWWHLKMGQIIVETASIPRIDLFSFTASGKLFIVQNWLAECVYYLAYRLGGFSLLIFLNAVLLVSALLPVYILARNNSPQLWIAVSAASLVTFAIPCNVRPQVFSFPLFAACLWILYEFRDARRDRLWLLPLLMLLWVNLHGAFVVGLGLVAFFLACEAIKSSLASSTAERLSTRQLRKLAITAALCLVATLVNPEGYKVYSYIQTVMHDPPSQQFVVEWQPPRIDTVQGALLFYFPFFLTLTVLISARRRHDFTDLMLFFGFAAFGMTATRNSVWFILVGCPILARYLSTVDWSWLRETVELPQPAAGGTGSASIRRYEGKRSIRWLNSAVASLSCLIVLVMSPWVQERVYRATLLEAKTPVHAIDYIDQHALNGNIFHPQAYGDYLIWRLWPRQHSFFDGRVHLFGEEFVHSYQQVFRDSHWDEILAKFQIRYLLLEKDGDTRKGCERLIEEARGSGLWKILFEDDLSILFERVEDAAFAR